MIKRFFKKRDAAQVGVGEMDIAIRFHSLFANTAPDKVRPWADHCVAPTHYVDPRGQIVNVGMSTSEIGQAHIREIPPFVIWPQ